MTLSDKEKVLSAIGLVVGVLVAIVGLLCGVNRWMVLWFVLAVAGLPILALSVHHAIDQKKLRYGNVLGMIAGTALLLSGLSGMHTLVAVDGWMTPQVEGKAPDNNATKDKGAPANTTASATSTSTSPTKSSAPALPAQPATRTPGGGGSCGQNYYARTETFRIGPNQSNEQNPLALRDETRQHEALLMCVRSVANVVEVVHWDANQKQYIWQPVLDGGTEYTLKEAGVACKAQCGDIVVTVYFN